MEIHEQYELVVDTLRLIGSSYQDQKGYLPDFVFVPEEVVSDFEWAFQLLPQLIEAGKFSYKSITAFLRTYIKMQWCLINSDINDFSNLEWNKVRELAKETLKEMGESFEKPDMSWWTYVE